MTKLIKIEKVLFYFLSLVGFWQLRFIFTPASQQFNEWTSFSLYATDLIILAILSLWLVRRFKVSWLSVRFEFKRLIPKSAADFLWLFLFVTTLSLSAAWHCGLGLYRLIKLLEFAGLFFYVYYNFFQLYTLKRFWQFFIAGAAGQSVVAAWQFFTQQSLGFKFFAESPLAPDLVGVAKIVVNGEKIIRAYGLVPHPNILAAMLMVAIFGAAWLFMQAYSGCPFQSKEQKRAVIKGIKPQSKALDSSLELAPQQSSWVLKSPIFCLRSDNMPAGALSSPAKIKNFIFAAILFLLSTALFFTFSRSVAIVGYVFFIGWLIYLFWQRKELRRAIILAGVLLFIVNCLLLIVYWPYLSTRFDLRGLGDSQSVKMRIFYNQTALDFVKTDPWLGLGIGNFVPVLADLYNNLQTWVFQPVHNIYLLMAAETGLVGLLAFLAFLLLTIKDAWSRRKNLSVSCLLFIVGCLLFFGLFDHFLWDLQQGQILFWLMLGLLSAHSSMDRAQASEA